MKGAILLVMFFVLWVIGALIIDGIEKLIKRKKAHKRYVKHLETEIQTLSKTINFLTIELQTKEV